MNNVQISQNGNGQAAGTPIDTELYEQIGRAITDEVWNKIQPLLPRIQRKSRAGRRRLDNRACLAGVLYVLWTNIPWRSFPVTLGSSSGITCWRRYTEWKRAGIWSQICEKLRDDVPMFSKIHSLNNEDATHFTPAPQAAPQNEAALARLA